MNYFANNQQPSFPETPAKQSSVIGSPLKKSMTKNFYKIFKEEIVTIDILEAWNSLCEVGFKKITF